MSILFQTWKYRRDPWLSGSNFRFGSAAAVLHLRESVSFTAASRPFAGSIDGLFGAKSGNGELDRLLSFRPRVQYN